MNINFDPNSPNAFNPAVNPPVKTPAAAAEPKDGFVQSAGGDEGTQKHKLVMLQIDGLSRPALEKAMADGYAPHLKAMIENGSHIMRSFSSGIAAVTVPILSSIFYGIELPANDWYDKRQGKMIDSIATEQSIQEELARKGQSGILTGGAAYSSPFSGGAEETGAVVSVLKQEAKEHGYIKTFLKEAKKEISLLKKGGYSLTRAGWHVVRDIFKLSRKLIKAGEFNTATDRLGTILMSLNENVIPQVATEGIKKAIDDHRPTAYVDYAAYDEQAHFFGPESKDAFLALKEIDGLIGQIMDKASSSGDKYDVIVFSDHGQTPSSLFNKLYGKPAGEVIKDLAEQCNPSGYERGDIEFSDAYSLGDIYFTKDKNKAVQIREIEKKFPGFTDKLVDHPGIGLVVTRDNDSYVMRGKEGTLVVDREARAVRQDGSSPLAHFGDEELLRKQISSYMNLPQTGDIVIFGEYDGEKVVDFNKKYSLASLHGGIGGNQTKPFILTDPALPLARKEIVEATDLNKLYHDNEDHIG
ncbi:MAG: alkaline phosphatase family protein [Candidatus Eremiobacteraeota bacterium]|nr:alkaline phosphatase family protein [Candidatus Eremiobacteraeota bacterium]